MAFSVITGTVPALSGLTLLARVRGNSGELITQSGITSMSYTVSNLTAGTTGTTTALTVSSTVFDNLQQNDPRWNQDSADHPGPDGEHGFNFAAIIPASAFPVSVLDSSESDPVPARQTYQVDVVITPTTGQPFRMIFRTNPANVYS